MKRWKLIPLHKRSFSRCCWDRRDVILFSTDRKITASRKNRGELLGDKVIKPRSIAIAVFKWLLNRIWPASTGQEMGVSFYIAKPLCWFQSRSLNSRFSAVQYNSVKNEESQHFVSSNICTVGYHNSPKCNCNLFLKLLCHILCYSVCSIINWGNHSHITWIPSSNCSLYW